MPVTRSQFLTDLPEFNTAANPSSSPNAISFSTSTIDYYLALANASLDPNRWGGDPSVWFTLGVEMYVAHWVVLDTSNQRDVPRDRLPGWNKGAVAGQGAGGVSISYDTAGAQELGAGHWNLTTYGTRYINLARQMGAGPIQIGPSGCGGPLNGPAWPGPWFANFPNPSD